MAIDKEDVTASEYFIYSAYKLRSYFEKSIDCAHINDILRIMTQFINPWQVKHIPQYT